MDFAEPSSYQLVANNIATSRRPIAMASEVMILGLPYHEEHLLQPQFVYERDSAKDTSSGILDPSGDKP